MKNLVSFLAITAAMAVSSCNNAANTKTDHAAMDHSTSMPMEEHNMTDEHVKTVTPTFSQVDPAVATYMKSMTQCYLSVKNSLTEGNADNAANASGKMLSTMKAFDKSRLTPEQEKAYNDIEADLQENAEHISKSKLDHQREHFVAMSEDMYDLVKAFGAGMTLYHDQCPMYKEGGAMWLSETKDIRNPYYGGDMMDCGGMEEIMK